jgi:hypothetical protein
MDNANYLDFDSAIPRFESSRPSQPVRSHSPQIAEVSDRLVSQLCQTTDPSTPKRYRHRQRHEPAATRRPYASVCADGADRTARQ